MELNAEKVKKALEIHTGILDMPCEECPYNQDNGSEICIDLLIADSLALIESYEKKIKELTEVVKQSETAGGCEESVNNGFSPSVTELQRENERLKAQKYYIHSDGRIEMIPTVESVRADTVRKMLERLKADAVAVQYHPGKIGVFVGVGNIDDAAREILECKDER